MVDAGADALFAISIYIVLSISVPPVASGDILILQYDLKLSSPDVPSAPLPAPIYMSFDIVVKFICPEPLAIFTTPAPVEKFNAPVPVTKVTVPAPVCAEIPPNNAVKVIAPSPQFKAIAPITAVSAIGPFFFL